MSDFRWMLKTNINKNCISLLYSKCTHKRIRICVQWFWWLPSGHWGTHVFHPMNSCCETKTPHMCTTEATRILTICTTLNVGAMPRDPQSVLKTRVYVAQDINTIIYHHVIQVLHSLQDHHGMLELFSLIVQMTWWTIMNCCASLSRSGQCSNLQHACKNLKAWLVVSDS